MTAKTTRLIALLIHRWYKCLSYLHEDAIKKLTNLADGMEITSDNSDASMCQLCLQGK